MSIQNKTKKTLKARDIERLENTSFASALIGGTDLADETAVPENSPVCTGASCDANSCVCSLSCGDSCGCIESISCGTACSCACVSVACCNTHTLTCNVLELKWDAQNAQ